MRRSFVIGAEIAPGPARLTVDVAPFLREITLIDTSLQMLHEARHRMQRSVRVYVFLQMRNGAPIIRRIRRDVLVHRLQLDAILRHLGDVRIGLKHGARFFRDLRNAMHVVRRNHGMHV